MWVGNGLLKPGFVLLDYIPLAPAANRPGKSRWGNHELESTYRRTLCPAPALVTSILRFAGDFPHFGLDFLENLNYKRKKL